VSQVINLKLKCAPSVHGMCRGSNWPCRYEVMILFIMNRLWSLETRLLHGILTVSTRF